MVSTILSLLSSGLSAVLSGLSAVWEAAKRNPMATIGLVVKFAVFMAGGYAGYWYRGTQIPERNRAWIDFTDRSGKLERLLGGTKPDRAERGRAPDSSGVDTVRVKVPEYIPRTDTVFQSLPHETAFMGADVPEVSIDAHLSANPYGFLLLPTPDGRPSVRVTSDRTTIRTIDPRNAAPIQLEYDHPGDVWGIGPIVRPEYESTDIRRFRSLIGAWIGYRAVRVDGGALFRVEEPFGPDPKESFGWTVGLEWAPDLSDVFQ